jgi:hypothetical protein
MSAAAAADSPATSYCSFTPSLDIDLENLDQLARNLILADNSPPIDLLDDASSSSLSCPPAEPLTDASDCEADNMREDVDMQGMW